jgi:EAL domain-containing protein (putative c-di-GMP-specific phosphodiesterase class I)
LGKPQDFSDLAHGSTGTGHRHLSSMDFIEGQGAVSDDLTPVLLTISEEGWPLPVKHAAKTRETRGQFRRIQVANSRETGWRKLVKSALGVHAVACAPVRHEQLLIGLIAIYAKGSVEDVAVAEALPALVEAADLAGALIGRDVAERTEAGRGRGHIADVIARRAFGPVFQPIVELRHNAIVGYEAITRFGDSNAIVGYEALTRFTDGSDPELMFVQAAAVGLGPELETVTLGAALAASEALPESAWLNLNASPDLIMAGEPLGTLLRGSRRRLVLEVTEHTAIADYPAFRAAIAALGLKVDLAVDDAGAGFSSLRHILELHPAFVKLDRSLVAGIESDEARHAMVVGLNHFARATGCRLIAEGIETDGELAVLRALDIPLGQGYLLGRPLPVGGA